MHRNAGGDRGLQNAADDVEGESAFEAAAEHGAALDEPFHAEHSLPQVVGCLDARIVEVRGQR
ncbi:MAG: hypothetical protein JW940_15890 [Polyangiaceae bacterium]|nr:hypothetical protein [Polyangiaceae bacterium]